MTTRRSIPYVGSGSRFYLASELWIATIEALQYYARFDSEGMVLWGGSMGAAGETTVTSLLRINHDPQGWRVRPSSESMRSLLRTLRARDEKLVAQVHSHPGEAFHSKGDDAKPTAFDRGFISIVVPNFGVRVTRIHDCAVYELRATFEALSPTEIDERFIIQPLIVDLQPPLDEETLPIPTTPRRRIWTVLSQKLNSIALRRR
jgi:hypothetical protein